MRILYVSQYFPPEMGAPAARVHELSRAWVATGHDVTVLTAFPNHPTGEIPAAYRAAFRRATMTEYVDGIRVVRTWLWPGANRFPSERILNYASFCVSGILRGLVLQRPDVVIATSPQLLVGLTGWVLARRFRRPFVFEVRDLWPESLPASGISHADSRLYRTLERLAEFLYRSADLIVPVTEPFRFAITAKAPTAKIAVIENGVDIELFRPFGSAGTFKRKSGTEQRFVVSYVGTLGFAHGLGTVLDSAALLRERAPDVLFLIVGEGAERAALEGRIVGERLTNVRILGQRPRTDIPEVIAGSDVCLVMLRRSALFETVLPSKMLEFMACARPIIVAVKGYAASLVADSEAGLAIEPENAEQLVDAILSLRADPARCAKLGDNGRRYVAKNFTRDAKASAYVSVLTKLARA